MTQLKSTLEKFQNSSFNEETLIKKLA